MTIEDKQREIIDEFSDIEDWLDRYAQIIDLGNELPSIDDSMKTPDRLIKGCQSRVWLDASLNDEGKVRFVADSDAIIVKGIISLLISVLDGHTPDEIIDANLHFINDIGLGEHLSPTRSNGLLAMVKQIRLYALAFKAKQESNNKY